MRQPIALLLLSAALIAHRAPAQPVPVVGDAVAVADADASLDIIVTARRRNELAQDVPVALSVVSSDALARTGAANLAQITQLVPSLQLFSFNPRNTNVNIRGLGSNVALANDGFEQGVGIVIDGVYYGRIGQSQFELVDLAQVEVLRGPQSTLFGKNTTAGVVSVTTRAPSFDPEFQGEATLGNYGLKTLRASASGPLVPDRLAVRLSGGWSERDGTLFNVRTGRDVHGQENRTVRGQLLWAPSEAIRLRLIADYTAQRQECCINVLVSAFQTYDSGAAVPNNFSQRVARAGYTPLPFRPFDRRTDADGRFRADMDGYGISGQLDSELGGAALTGITAARWWDWNPANDGDSVGLDVVPVAQQVNRQRQFSQELRLASTGERSLDWVVGLYAFHQVVRGYGATAYGVASPNWFLPAVPAAISNAALNGFRADSTSTPRTRSYAAFGQASWSATERLTLTAGLRLTHERKRGNFEQRQTAGADLALLPAAQAAAAQGIRNNFNPLLAFETAFEETSLSGLVNLAYDLSGDALVYGLYSRGNKSGGLNLSVIPAGVDPNVKPETVDNFEIGLKSQLADRRITLNLAAYWTEVRDFQTAITEQIATTVSFRQYIANIPRVRSRGFEADAAWAPTERLRLSGSLAYTDATYRDYPNAQTPVEALDRGPLADLTGARLSGVPKISYTLAADGDLPVGQLGGDPLDLYASADWNYRSSYYTAVSNSRYTLVPGYGLLGARLGLRTGSGAADLSLFVRNLLDKQHFQTLGANNFGLVNAILGDPRTFGITFRTRL